MSWSMAKELALQELVATTSGSFRYSKFLAELSDLQDHEVSTAVDRIRQEHEAGEAAA